MPQLDYERVAAITRSPSHIPFGQSFPTGHTPSYLAKEHTTSILTCYDIKLQDYYGKYMYWRLRCVLGESKRAYHQASKAH